MVALGYDSWASSPAVRRVMQGNRKRDTRLEIPLRRILYARGLRYRVAARSLAHRPWTADLVFRGARLAVFVDGCYWHGCAERYASPRTNQGYWSVKIEPNLAWDRHVDTALLAPGWTALHIWEREPAGSAVDRVVATLQILRDEA